MQIGSSSLFLFLAAFIGLLVGLLIANIFSSKEGRGNKRKSIPKEMENEGFAESATLWYSPAGKKVITEMDGEFYRDTGTLSTDQKTRVLNLLSLWQAWTEKEKPVVFEPAPQPIEPQSEEVLPQKEAVPVQPFKVEPEEQNNVSDLQQKYETPEEESIAAEPVQKPALSITEQISEILDSMLEGTPLKEKGIRLIENQQHGVDVWVGLDKYSGIDAVPDPAVKDLIRNAVIRWEEENDPRRKTGSQ